MELEFGQPWLVFAGVALLIGAALVGMKRRRISPVLFVLAGAAFFTGGARPALSQSEPAVRHALIVDVSDSMESRELAGFVDSIAGVDLPANHSLVRFELSDALREQGAVRGDGTDYARVGDFTANEDINGEVLFITDGRGSFDDLYGAVAPARLIVLRPPPADRPDARVLDLRAPNWLLPGSPLHVRATIECDADASVPWKLLHGEAEVASGNQSVRANQASSFTHTLLEMDSGLHRVTLQLQLPNDRESRNDESLVRVSVGGSRDVQYCVPREFNQEADALFQILSADESNDLNIRHDLPLSSTELESVSAVVINNLPLATTGEQLGVLAEWVNNGGNLIMVGTDGAFGPGGYRGTPIEAVMPVRFRPDDSPPRRTLLLLDVSQSMGDRLPGGETKLQRMKAAALRFRDALGGDDQAGVVGFRESLAGDITYFAADSDNLVAAIEALGAGGTTHIRSSLAQAVEAVPDETRILMITDGEEVEGATAEQYREIGLALASSNLRLDIVLTTAGDKPWLEPLKQSGGEAVQVWSVGGEGFDGLLETLDRAMAGADREWIIDELRDATGSATQIPRLVRTALRDESSVKAPVRVTSPDNYPVLSTRVLVGRSVAICTDSWGDANQVRLWSDAEFREHIDDALAFALENQLEIKLVLNPLESGAELVWTGPTDPPMGDLQTDAGVARMDTPGRWLLDEFPDMELMRVFHGQEFIQRIPLPRRVPEELRHTGNDDAFFARTEAAGIRVFSGLGAWSPRQFSEQREEPTDLTWLPALVAMLLLIGGFATRRR